MRRAQQQTITFDAIDSSAPPANKSGLTFASGDTKISKDGGAFANTTNNPAEIGSSGVYSLVLTAAETDCMWLHVYAEKTGMQRARVSGSTFGNPSGAVSSNAGNTASTFLTNLTSAVTDFWKNAFVTFTSGSLAGQTRQVTGYDGSTKFLSFTTPFTSSPSNGDLFVIVNL